MDLCFITCNIRFDNPADGQNDWAHRRIFLAETLSKHSPDIIATQEGRFHQLKDLESLLPDYEILDLHRSWIKERMYPTFFLKKDKFEILKSEDIWLSETPDVAASLSFGSTFPRLMVMAKVQLKNSPQNIVLVNTHLDHLKTDTREEQIKVLAEQVKRFSPDSTPVIIAGDFNDHPESQVRIHLENEFLGLQDAWKLFNGIEETSHHAFTGVMPTGARIDWIMMDQKFKIKSCDMDKTSRNGFYPTDHFPVVCHFNI